MRDLNFLLKWPSSTYGNSHFHQIKQVINVLIVVPNSSPFFFFFSNSSNKIFLKALSAQISVHNILGILSPPSMWLFYLHFQSVMSRRAHFHRKAGPARVVVSLGHIYIIRFTHLAICLSWARAAVHFLSALALTALWCATGQVQLVLTLHLGFLPVPILPHAAAGN